MRRALGIGAWLLTVAAGLGVFLVLPHLVSDFHSRDLARAGVFFIAIVGLNLLTGYTGQISLGHGALMAIGGYTTAALIVCGSPGSTSRSRPSGSRSRFRRC